ncbi:MAG: hypothetical protein VX466_13015 [Myxococcota bacterium]|nr:hypothetical protein [Myxococcota bacterium]
MPDTQSYTFLANQPAGANHLDLVTRYICRHRSAWTEPSTGKTMPILMVMQLGDLVELADREEKLAGPFAEWKRVDAAFQNLDRCSPKVPYVVTNGNHEVDDFTYERPSVGYGTYFHPDRWAKQGVACKAPDDCDWSAGQYFLGAGDPIAPNSRNFIDDDGGRIGPAVEQVGRHRAARIEAPNGQPFLFLGLEQAFDFPPAAAGYESVERDDAAWPKRILEVHPRVATIVFHHSLLWAFPPPDTRIRWGPETWRSQSIRPPAGTARDPDFASEGGMKDLFDLLIEPYPQVRFLFSGHVYKPTHQADYTIPRNSGPPVWAFMRNYQRIGLPGRRDRYGVGWNAVAVFDPEAQQVRVRSYRIDDVESYAVPPVNHDHRGEPAATECLETDQGGIGERVITWDFKTSDASAPTFSGSASKGPAVSVAVAALSTPLQRSQIP